MQNLEQQIRGLIKLKGAITLDHFMGLCISHYYKYNTIFGKNGDFTTAPEISQMFGEMLGVWCANHYLENFTHDIKFNLIELGPGRGALMKDLLRSLKNVKGFYENLNKIYLLENSDSLRKKQELNLYDYIDKVVWIDDLTLVDISLPNLIIANEFFDALPIKQYKKLNNMFYEVGLNIINEQFEFITLNKALPLKVDDCSENGIIEINMEANYYIKQLAKLLKVPHSKAVFIDYGYTKPSYKSTLQAVQNHKFCHPLSNLGTADLTALVDFNVLKQSFEMYNLDTTLKTQRNFLVDLGIELRANALKTRAASIESELERLISTMGELFLVLEVRLSN